MKNKLDLAIKNLKDKLLDKNLNIKTNNEQRIMIRAICQELKIAHYALTYPEYNNFVDIYNSYTELYTSWSEGSIDTLFYSTHTNYNTNVINFEDLIEEFNQFKK